MNSIMRNLYNTIQRYDKAKSAAVIRVFTLFISGLIIVTSHSVSLQWVHIVLQQIFELRHEKTDNMVFPQVRLKPSYTSTEG